jgi:signal transduction histidine kinase
LQKLAPPDAQAVYDAIEQEAQRMTRLISDLLLLAQSDAGATMLKKETVELDTLMLEVYRQARVMTTGRNGDLRVTLGHEDQALVEGDPDRLKQLLLNLVENAIKYTPSGEIQLAIRKQSGEVGFSVSDTGLGIPSEDVPHIFERFYRVDKARTRAQGGTGLGLSIAQWIAQAHGGRIEVESELGKGSTFTVWLKEKP